MINKQSLWFITLFSLILILGIYYVSMPEESLDVFNEQIVENTEETIDIKESDIIVAMKVEEEEKILSEMENAQNILLNDSSSTEDKNEAYEMLRELNSIKGKILEIEKLIKDKFNIDACVKFDNNNINVILSSEDKGKEFANNIIKEIQKLYENQVYITVKFQK